MKARLLLAFLAALFCLSVPAKSFAQGCGTTMRPGYHTYVSYSVYRRFTNWVVAKNVHIDGSSSIVLGPGCQIPPSTFHYPSINSRLGGNYTGTINGAQVYPTAYLSQDVSHTMIIAPGVVYPDGADIIVHCSIVGSIYSTSGSGGGGGSVTNPRYFEYAYERVYAGTGSWSNCTTATATGIITCDISVTEWCSPATTPPDMNLAFVRDQVFPTRSKPYYDAFGLGFRFTTSGPFTFLNISTYAIGLLPPQNLGACTKNT